MFQYARECLRIAARLSPWGFTWLYAVAVVLRGEEPLSLVPFTVSILVSLIISILAWKKTGSSLAFGISAFVFLLPAVIQLQSLHLSGDMLSPLALENADSAKVTSVTASQVAPLSLLLLFCACVALWRGSVVIRLNSLTSLVVVVSWLSLSAQNLVASDLGNPLRLPGLSLAMTVTEMTVDGGGAVAAGDRRASGMAFARETTYHATPASDAALTSVPARPNIIVLFVEGMSARLVQAYGGNHDGLTPNLDRFYAQSVIADNYYNHTAATLRGLRGQLTSSFIAATEGGEDGLGTTSATELKERQQEGMIVSVPQLLGAKGYETAFLTPHPDHMNINEILRGVGFDKVVSGSEVAAARNLPDEPISDRELYGYLPQLAAGLKQPFFLGVYNFGTHLFQDSPDEKFGDGKSVVLNRFHNFDTQFGLFLDHFMSSSLADNTVLIVTADHAAFPAPELLEVEEATPNVFVDRIPLMMFWKGVRHRQIDMEGRNSLALAPTVMNIAKIRNGKNYFLGCSAFETACDPVNHVSKIDGHFFFTESGSVTYFKDMPFSLKFDAGLEKVRRFLAFSGY